MKEYTMLNKDDIVSQLLKYCKLRGFKKSTKKDSPYYYNDYCSFDIETTSTYINKDNKFAFMYEWNCHIADMVIEGRTWSEFLDLTKLLFKTMELDCDKRRLAMWIHNLPFEFAFLCKYFTWIDVFALDDRKPVRALSSQGIEFRCSYTLSGYSLAKLAENLNHHTIRKLTGDLDYSLIRHSDTPLSKEERQYCINDVLIVSAYIEEQIEEFGSIAKIPMTNTSRVRNYCRDHCDDAQYKKLMESLVIDPAEYEMLKAAFHGGFTHSNAYRVGEICENVASYDFTSSYPAVMVAEKYPMSTGKKIDNCSFKELKNLMKSKCCIFQVAFQNLSARPGMFEHPLSFSRCSTRGMYELDNGRIVWAQQVDTVTTEVDFEIYERYYQWDQIAIGTVYVYSKQYLPTPFIESVLKLYSDKTTLKDVEGKEVEYQRSKGMLNSCYGMMVTDINRESFTYDESGWYSIPANVEENIEKYNKSKKRFLFYVWGIYVTAYAMRNLFTGINNLGSDYIYSDTDSVKFLNPDKHKAYFEEYNNVCIKKMQAAMDYHKLPYDLVAPKTVKGVIKYLGVWDYEGVYDKFKTLGSKRYITYKNGKYNITIAGLGKIKGRDFMVKTYGDKVLENFKDGLFIPAEETGKQTHTYIDTEMESDIIDYLGNEKHVKSESGVHLEAASFELSLSEDFVKFLQVVHTMLE